MFSGLKFLSLDRDFPNLLNDLPTSELDAVFLYEKGLEILGALEHCIFPTKVIYIFDWNFFYENNVIFKKSIGENFICST